MSRKKNVVDLDALEPETRRLVEKAIGRRDTQFATRFRGSDLAAWKQAAKDDDEGITDWMEHHLNEALKRRSS